MSQQQEIAREGEPSRTHLAVGVNTMMTTETVRAEGAPQEGARNESKEGRRSNGRFARGNKGGPGNPFARQTARMRSAFLRELKPEDMRALARKLIEDAKAGDKRAAK